VDWDNLEGLLDTQDYLTDEVVNAQWMREGRWAWLRWTAELAAMHHPARDGRAWDHDSCHFCHEASFSEAYDGDLREGWTAEWLPRLADAVLQGPGYHWVCPDCFDELRDYFGWSVTATSTTAASR
jgi:hypothetical protein